MYQYSAETLSCCAVLRRACVSTAASCHFVFVFNRITKPAFWTGSQVDLTRTQLPYQHDITQRNSGSYPETPKPVESQQSRVRFNPRQGADFVQHLDIDDRLVRTWMDQTNQLLTGVGGVQTQQQNYFMCLARLFDALDRVSFCTS